MAALLLVVSGAIQDTVIGSRKYKYIFYGL